MPKMAQWPIECQDFNGHCWPRSARRADGARPAPWKRTPMPLVKRWWRSIRRAPWKPSDEAYQRAVDFLLRTQLANGSWLVRSRSFPIQPYRESGFPHGKNQWISAAGTSWAARALSLAAGASVATSECAFRRIKRNEREFFSNFPD